MHIKEVYIEMTNRNVARLKKYSFNMVINDTMLFILVDERCGLMKKVLVRNGSKETCCNADPLLQIALTSIC